jgi:hypothetical protein
LRTFVKKSVASICLSTAIWSLGGQVREFRALHPVKPCDAFTQQFSGRWLGFCFCVKVLDGFYVIAIVKLRMGKHLAGHREQRLPLVSVEGLQAPSLFLSGGDYSHPGGKRSRARDYECAFL